MLNLNLTSSDWKTDLWFGDLGTRNKLGACPGIEPDAIRLLFLWTSTMYNRSLCLEYFDSDCKSVSNNYSLQVFVPGVLLYRVLECISCNTRCYMWRFILLRGSCLCCVKILCCDVTIEEIDLKKNIMLDMNLTSSDWNYWFVVWRSIGTRYKLGACPGIEPNAISVVFMNKYNRSLCLEHLILISKVLVIITLFSSIRARCTTTKY